MLENNLSNPDQPCAQRLSPSAISLSQMCDSLLHENTDLRAMYRLISGKAAPEEWAEADWASASTRSLAATIADDFIRELEASGFRVVGDAYDCFYQGNADGYWKEYLWTEDLIRGKIGKWVSRRQTECLERDFRRRKSPERQ